jgi:hypothetical protein
LLASNRTLFGLAVTVQHDDDIFVEQSASFQQIVPNAITYPRFDGQQGGWYTADFSGSGDQPGGGAAVAIDFTEPTTQPSASDSGCEASDFDPPPSPARSCCCNAAPVTSA